MLGGQRIIVAVGVRKILRKVPGSTAITKLVLNTQRFVESFVVFAVPLRLSHRRVGQVEVVLEATGEVLVLVPEGIHEILERLLFLDAGKSTGGAVLGVGGGGLVFAAAAAAAPVLALHEKVVEVWLVLGE